MMCSKPSVSKVYTTTGSMEELVEYLRLLLEEILESFDVQMLESGPNSVISMAYLYILGSLLGLRKLLEGSMFNQRKLNDAKKEEEANNLYDDDDDDDLENDDESEKKSLFDDLEALLDSENFDDFIETFFNYSTYFFLPIIIYIFGIYILHGLGGFYSVYVDYFQKNPDHFNSPRGFIPSMCFFFLMIFF